jgi:hypothetical protein
LTNRFGSVGFLFEFLADLFDKTDHTTRMLLDLASRQPICSRRVAPRVTGEPLPGVHERSAIAHQIEQVGKDFVLTLCAFGNDRREVSHD